MDNSNSSGKKKNKSKNRQYQGGNRPKPVTEQESKQVSAVDAAVNTQNVEDSTAKAQQEQSTIQALPVSQAASVTQETAASQETPVLQAASVSQETSVLQGASVIQEEMQQEEPLEIQDLSQEEPIVQERTASSRREKSAARSPKRETRTVQRPRRKKTTVQPARRAIRQYEKRSLSERVASGLIAALKILLPVAACVIVIAVIVSFVHTRRQDESSQSGNLMEEPLAKNEYADVNALMADFYRALADGDMDTVKALRDYNDETAIITYDKKSEFIESYDDVTCYTKSGIEEGSYFVYVTYMVKIEGIETKAPGLNAFYVYPAEDGKLIIDGAMEKNVEASLKLVTSQDDVVDLYTKIDVSYRNALEADETLNTFMKELPIQIKSEVGEALALAQLDQQNGEDASATGLVQDAVTQIEGLGDANGAGAGSAAIEETPEGANTSDENAEAQPQEEELLENKTVNQIVRATDTVNVRSSDSEEADRIGRVAAGTELTRLEERINGWSKVMYEGREAFIKSDYLEVLSTEAEGNVIRTVKATTNVNVRNDASQEAAKLGVAQAGNSYDLLEDLGEWYKINYNGQNGYAKAEFFE